MGIALKWVGQPGQFVAGVPAGDLEVGTEEEAADLIAGGLYEAAAAPPPGRGRKAEDAPAVPAEQEA